MFKFFVRAFLALAFCLSLVTPSPAQAQEVPVFTLTVLTSQPIVGAPIDVEMVFNTPFDNGEYYQGSWLMTWPTGLINASIPGSSTGGAFSGNSASFTKTFRFYGTPKTHTLHLEWSVQNEGTHYDGSIDLPVEVKSVEYPAVFDYLPYRPDFGPELEIRANGGAKIEISFNGETYELVRDLAVGSNFFQTAGWQKFRFVAKDGFILYPIIQNESEYWDANGFVFTRHVFNVFLPLLSR